jgi:hypothetical protein
MRFLDIAHKWLYPEFPHKVSTRYRLQQLQGGFGYLTNVRQPFPEFSG